MCPLCIGSAFWLITGTSSAGGIAVLATRVIGKQPTAQPDTAPRADSQSILTPRDGATDSGAVTTMPNAK